jgi:hypothetical protein
MCDVPSSSASRPGKKLPGGWQEAALKRLRESPTDLRNDMKQLLIGITALAAVSAAFTTIAAPAEDHRIQTHRVQQAKLTGAPPASAAGMHEHMPLMQEMNRQLQQARSVDEMSPEQMRGWITQHLRLMNQMHQQMMSGQAPMMEAPGAPARPGQ